MPRDVFRVTATTPQRAIFGRVESERQSPPAWLTQQKPGAHPAGSDPRRPPTVPPPGHKFQRSASRHPPAPSAPPGQGAPAAYDARLEAESLAAEMRESWRAPPAESSVLSEALEELGQHIYALDAERKNAMKGLEREIWPLVRAIVERVLEREIRSDDTLAMRLIREGLHALADSSEVSVTLGPGFIENAPDLETALSDAGTRVRVVMDRSLPPYSCHVETPLGSVTESLEQRLDNILSELMPEANEA